MIAWKGMDERERAVWSATYAAFMTYQYEREEARLEDSVEMADRAVRALREHVRKESSQCES
jgi:hypothetical protein